MSGFTIRPPTSQMFANLKQKLDQRGYSKDEVGAWLDQEKKVENGFFDLFDKMGKASEKYFDGSNISITVGSGVSGAKTAMTEVLEQLDKVSTSLARANLKNDTDHAKSLAIDLQKLMEVTKTAADRARAAWEDDTTQTRTNYETVLSQVAQAITEADSMSDTLWGIHKDTNYKSDTLRKELSALNTDLQDARSAKSSLDSSLNGSVDIVA